MARLFTTNPYSVVKMNFVAAVRTGQIAAQYELDASIATAGVQNGQLLVVDEDQQKNQTFGNYC